KKLLIIYNLALFAFLVALFYFVGNLALMMLVAAAADLIFIRSVVLTKKPLLILARLFRPLLILGLLESYLLLFNKVGLIAFTTVNLIFISLHTWLIYHEIQSEKNSITENVLSLGLIFLIANLAAIGVGQLNWPVEIVLAIAWILNFLIVSIWAQKLTARSEIFATVWALLIVEIIWILSNWLVFYQPVNRLFISQISLIITALGYSLGGILIHQKNKTLSRSVAAEYLSVSGLVFIVLMILTRWTISL
ncbi:MAG: hypothetical protein Q8P54_02840, partial [bacterium]|nr:hypothetical protein [bacterium]